jgi:signal recognition particle subunit SEC65
MAGSGEPPISAQERVRPRTGAQTTDWPADQEIAVTPGTSGKRLPDFFIVGHEKCGTSALDLMLKRHPQIFLPDTKEQKFFVPELRAGRGARKQSDRGRPHTFDGYLAVFAAASAQQCIGEASPQYLRSRSAANRIAAVQPAAKIIAILREPTSFLRSFHIQATQNHNESQRDFRKAIALEPLRREGRRIPRRCRVPQTLFYSEHVRYVDQLRRFHAVFPPDQVLVLIYEDFRRDNRATVREVLRFLEVDDTFPVETVETKPRNAVRSMRLHEVRRAIRRAGLNPAAEGGVSRTIDALAPRRLRSDALAAMFRRAAYAAPRPPDEGLMLELRGRFKPEVVALSDYLGRDLVTFWGYESIS